MAEAEALLSEAVDAFRAALGDRLVAAYALGSLARGGFSALVSDVDLGLILADPVQSRDGEMIEAIAESQKRAGSALAERLSVLRRRRCVERVRAGDSRRWTGLT